MHLMKLTASGYIFVVLSVIAISVYIIVYFVGSKEDYFNN
jgi:hypothetical protein